MPVRVLLFASYAEALGRDEVAFDPADEATIADVLAHLRTLPGADRLPPRPLVAVNARYATVTDAIRSGDEIAIIPPVAGG
ncbi:MAG: MoaD/ThiS family protein [Gemmatimonadetes bacterium]|nr:MoaD/ThiS family protein [Gemmatimonadota bacterium]